MFYQQGINATAYFTRTDFLKIAVGFGLNTCDLKAAQNPQAALAKAIQRPRPCMIQALIDIDKKVFPRVPTGDANIDMIGE